ncbi:MAG: hypothetical protein COW19_03805 [Zetaproteobacteria bacterium CG12_big_fil_rev_8_21_14_0_65_55_1124]|nr:MAG: hypothetical protein AUJ58_09215 [Zetaproteobacteria bacterium CG1_02_55_237]PIS18673.1 MAG: hypothetical protein COT53_09695 [Zetaproteobacteria bacterium CG08_land_8_20_14_0_20_55_17]PIW43277.1 MAG: hypothetical protein COW19_03805 [Zetaproteobacteria bacterium CG12_big_fil_rev_8_21_14_0_65_55_1124]PIY53408.1 MAG: hypothetical protein COZ01_04040 [Zetaproteobacteria bacterium CG_4_10_14_0_8_um_filter_55_43]PIZ38689.1 MAG: hypothetical protein COY36_05455 [Zetaproteobacteria bacterium 
MHNASDIPPVGAGSAIAQIKQRKPKQQRQESKNGQQHKSAQKPQATPVKMMAISRHPTKTIRE